jgi:LPS sulfotransferase NodH
MTIGPSQQPGAPIRLSYLICTTPRTGSNFLCEVLQRTGVAGRPDEYFWHPPIWQENWSTPTFSAYLERVRRQGTSPTGVFGVKLMWSYLDELLPRLADSLGLTTADALTILSAAFPNPQFIWLSRRDKVRQAISHFRALHTNAWRSTDTPNHPTSEIAFDFEAIDWLVRQSIADDQAWQAYFQQHRIEPLSVTYEELADDPAKTAQRILDHLGLPAPAAPWPPPWAHQPQADTLTDEWVRLYRANVAAGGAQA